MFVDFIFTNLNDSIAQSTFPSLIKLANITPVQKMTRKQQKIIIGQLVHCQMFQKYISDLCLSKCLNIFSQSSQNFIAVLRKVLVPGQARN